MSSNARDLAQWMRLELGNGKYDGVQLIKEEAIAPTHEPLFSRGKNPVTGSAGFYGRGWNIDFGRYGTVWGHAGAFSQGARTLVSLLPSEQLGIVVLANAFPTGVPEGLADSFFDLVFTGAPTEDWTAKWNALYTSMFEPAAAAAKKALWHEARLGLAGAPALGLCRRLCQRLSRRRRGDRGEWRTCAQARA